MGTLVRVGAPERASRTEVPPDRGASGDRVVVLEGVETAEGIGRAWDELADRAAAPACLRPGWILPWWRAFGRGRLDLITVRRDGRLVGLVPMQRRSGELRSLSNYHTPSFGLLAADPVALDSLSTGLIRRSPRRLTVAFLAEEDPAFAALEAASRRAGRPTFVRVLERCPYVSLEGTWDELIATRRHQFARELIRRRRRLHKRGRFELDVQKGTQDLERYFEEGLSIEGSGWKGRNGTAIGSSPATRGFYLSVARWLASRGSLRLSYLRLDGRSFAFELAFEERGRYYVLKSGYDETCRSDAPGILLRAATIERAFEKGLRRYDLLGKDDPWKREWTSTFEVQIQFQSFGRTPDAAVDWAAQRYLRPLARRLLKRRTPTAREL